MSSILFLFFEVRHHLGGDLGVGTELTADLGSLQNGLAVLVELELGDDHVAGVQAQGNGLAGGLVAGDALDVDNVLEAVDGDDLALTALVGATDDGDLVVLSDGDAADLQIDCQRIFSSGKISFIPRGRDNEGD